jgi:hypothetical protein
MQAGNKCCHPKRLSLTRTASNGQGQGALSKGWLGQFYADPVPSFPAIIFTLTVKHHGRSDDCQC